MSVPRPAWASIAGVATTLRRGCDAPARRFLSATLTNTCSSAVRDPPACLTRRRRTVGPAPRIPGGGPGQPAPGTPRTRGMLADPPGQGAATEEDRCWDEGWWPARRWSAGWPPCAPPPPSRRPPIPPRRTPRPCTARSWARPTRGRSTTCPRRASPSVSLLESGDAGPASGTRTVATEEETTSFDTITISVIGGLTYVKGNVGEAQRSLGGLSAAEAVAAASHWIEFSTTNSAFSQVVAGVRSHDVATELQLKGPLTLGHAAATLDGVAVERHSRHADLRQAQVDARVVLYVRAHGKHVPIEEGRCLTPRARPPPRCTSPIPIGVRRCGPEAPSGAVPLGPVSAVLTLRAGGPEPAGPLGNMWENVPSPDPGTDERRGRR